MSSVEAEQFEAYRPLMLSIAYRMLGSLTEAEDIVQEAYLRYQTTPPDQIVSHKAFLSTIVTRLCLNHLQSARAQREAYIGPWLPEPVLTGVDERFAPMQQVDGGGKARGAVTRPLHGREAVAQFVLASGRNAAPGFWAEVAEVNGEPAVILRNSDEVRLVLSIGVDQGRVQTIRAIRNPDKLQELHRALRAAGSAAKGGN